MHWYAVLENFLPLRHRSIQSQSLLENVLCSPQVNLDNSGMRRVGFTLHS